MTSALFLTKLTLILCLGSIALLLLRKVSASSKHLLCAVTLALAVLSPLTLKIPTFVHTPMLTLVANASSLVPTHRVRSWHLLMLLWTAGALLCLLRFLMGYAYLRWRTRSAPVVSCAGIVPIRLADINTPLLYGWLKPTMLMPEAFHTWSAERKQLAMAHELAHYQRRDHWTTLLVMAAQTLYWFHPLVWWLTATLEEHRERACDDLVLQRGASSSAYAAFLVDIARQQSSPVLFGCAMLHNKNHLKGRIMHILNSNSAPSSRRNRFAIASALSVIFLGCLLLPASANQQKIYKMSGADAPDTLPAVLHKIEPDYAERPKNEKIQGVVLLDLVINTDGRSQDIHVLKSLDPDLDQKAVEAVSQWEFKPATKGGDAVPVEAKIEVNFRLK